jgi:hypothetical protein
MMPSLAIKGQSPSSSSSLSPLRSYELFGNTFSDNDSLAAIVAGGIEAQVERWRHILLVLILCQLLIILTDVDGVYDRPPSHPQAKVIHTYTKQVANILSLRFVKKSQTEFEVGTKSLQGRGGMGAKVDAAMKSSGVKPSLSDLCLGRSVAEFLLWSLHPEVTRAQFLRSLMERNGELSFSGDETLSPLLILWFSLSSEGNELIDLASAESTNPATPSSTVAEIEQLTQDEEIKAREKQESKALKIARLIAEGSRSGSRAIQKVDSATRERILEESEWLISYTTSRTHSFTMCSCTHLSKQ